MAGFDPGFANDYRRGGRTTVEDLNEQSFGTWRHNISNYLGGAQLRARLRAMLGLE